MSELTAALRAVGTDLSAGLLSIGSGLNTIAQALTPPADEGDAVMRFLQGVNPKQVEAESLVGATLDVSPAQAFIEVLMSHARQG